MARDANDVLKQLIGDLTFQLAQLIAANELLQEKLAKLEAGLDPQKGDTL